MSSTDTWTGALIIITALLFKPYIFHPQFQPIQISIQPVIPHIIRAFLYISDIFFWLWLPFISRFKYSVHLFVLGGRERVNLLGFLFRTAPKGYSHVKQTN